MRASILVVTLLSGLAFAEKPAPGPSKDLGKEMAQALSALDQSLGLESYPPPHCLKWGFGHEITPAEVRACADEALKKSPLPDLGKKYAIAILMAAVGPQTMIAVYLDQPGWAVLSCDPGKPCPPRKAGDDKMGKRVVDRLDRACKNVNTIWIPEKKGCP
jgi:hypothetical protein